MLAEQQRISSENKRWACEKLESVVAIGLHKQTIPKTAYRYVLVVTRQDGNQTTIYRGLKELKWFQNQLAVEVSNYPEHEEAAKYLAKQKKKTKPGLITSSMGTSQRLRIIDAINMYFEVVTHYLYEVEQFRVLKYFLSPSPLDREAENWSQNGKTYFCYGNENNCTLSRNGDVMSRSHSTDDLLSTGKLPVQKKKIYRRRSASLTSLPDDNGIYVANEDHVPRDEDASFNVIGLKVGEKVEVLSKSETGWWFVKRISGSNEELFGYVPGSFLKPLEDSVSIISSNKDAQQITQEDPIYESICYPLSCSSTGDKKCKLENHLKIGNKGPQIIPRYHDDNNKIINTSLLRQQNVETPSLNRHKLRLQHLFANKV